MTDFAELVSRLDLPTKVALITGEDFWTTRAVPEIGLRKMTLSDGPSGVRGPVWDERSPSLNLPSATALASAWDVELAREYGRAAAAEAKRKDVDWVLGPTINLHRSPLGGRHFECFSEDPVLTGDLAAGYVEGMQALGVAATPKHYVANDFETDRFTVDVVVDERTLRELYLHPFERAVEAGTWSIMSSYNSVGGTTLTENELLRDPLRTEWGWDGVVVSDWTAVRSTAAAAAEQDLEMPAPGVWGDALLAAVNSGEVPEGAIDRHVERLLRLAERVGALGEAQQPGDPAPVDGIAFVRRASAEGSVLVSNDGILPLQADGLGRVAVIGHNARDARTQGGGSATVVPERVVNPLTGLRDALPGAEVTYSLGAVVQEGVAELAPTSMTNPHTGQPGLRVTFFGADGAELFHEDRFASALTWFGGDAPIAEATRILLETDFTPDESGPRALGFAATIHGSVYVDDELVLEDQPEVVGTDLGAALLAPPSTTADVDFVAGQARRIRVDFDLTRAVRIIANALALTVGTAPAAHDPEQLIADAAYAAADADVAVVVVGTNSKVESEGYDRENLDLPGRQDDLVAAVVAANPRTVVVVNSGSPVAMPWRDDVAAILIGYFGGQEFGNALADVLLGLAEPGGRLPTTWPKTMADVPVLNCTPDDAGQVHYDEGIHIGYRAWLKAGTEPAFGFGHGLGYTTWALENAAAEVTGGDVTVSVDVRNTGDREGKQVVQVYASRPDSVVDRPHKWLVGFAPVRVAAGEQQRVDVVIPERRFAHWADGWQMEPGAYQLHVGTSVNDVAAELEVVL